MAAQYRFSFGPWNIHEGADPFGPPVRPSVTFADKLKLYKKLGFDGVQFHDDDVIPNIDSKSASQVEREGAAVSKTLQEAGLVVEIIAPRLWEDEKSIDGAFTSNDAKSRQWALDRSKRAIDLAKVMKTNLFIFWYAREGSYIREAKRAGEAYKRLLDGINALLDYDKTIRIAIEPKPNEPMDHTYVPTIGHALAMGAHSSDPKRVGGLIETAHALLAGLDPSDEMAFALSLGKLWSVHLNDQNGLKYDQDKTFGSANLRTAYNQVRVLEQYGYAASGAFIGLDVKAMRTQRAEVATRHLENSRRVFLSLVEKVRTFDANVERQCIENRDYEALELAVMNHLMGVK